LSLPTWLVRRPDLLGQLLETLQSSTGEDDLGPFAGEGNSTTHLSSVSAFLCSSSTLVLPVSRVACT
jgi:hypothetical protein